MDYTLDFEKPVKELENQIEELKQASSKPQLDISGEIAALQAKVSELISEIYSNLSCWERVQLSRHPNRPHCQDYIDQMIEDFHEVHGDRRFMDDKAVIAGFGRLNGKKVAVVGIEKGRKTNEKIERNFGMPRPEGYRKALRVMKLAEQFGIPVISLVDTPGAYPGIGAEERGQSQAIAESIMEMSDLKTRTITVVIGEGGSGGALGIAVSDKVMMMEYSIYSVISPESCASILWSDPKKAEHAANSLQLDPSKAKEMGIIDGVIGEPSGGAHRAPQEAIQLVKEGLDKELSLLEKNSIEAILDQRYEKFRNMGNKTFEAKTGPKQED